MTVCVCVSVCVRERERERDCVCMCVCVCVGLHMHEKDTVGFGSEGGVDICGVFFACMCAYACVFGLCISDAV